MHGCSSERCEYGHVEPFQSDLYWLTPYALLYIVGYPLLVGSPQVELVWASLVESDFSSISHVCLTKEMGNLFQLLKGFVFNPWRSTVWIPFPIFYSSSSASGSPPSSLMDKGRLSLRGGGEMAYIPQRASFSPMVQVRIGNINHRRKIKNSIHSQLRSMIYGLSCTHVHTSS